MEIRPRTARSVPLTDPLFASARMNSLATISLISGFLGIVCLVPLLGSVVALIAGHTARRQIEMHRERGRERADLGIMLGWVGLVVVIAASIAAIIIVVLS